MYSTSPSRNAFLPTPYPDAPSHCFLNHNFKVTLKLDLKSICNKFGSQMYIFWKCKIQLKLITIIVLRMHTFSRWLARVCNGWYSHFLSFMWKFSQQHFEHIDAAIMEFSVIFKYILYVFLKLPLGCFHIQVVQSIGDAFLFHVLELFSRNFMENWPFWLHGRLSFSFFRDQ